MNLQFAKLMAGMPGRAIRAIAGLVIIALGLFVVGDVVGIVIAVVGLAPVFAGVFNVCLIAPLIGAPFRGTDALAKE